MASIGTIYAPREHTLGKRVYATAAVAGVTITEAPGYVHQQDNKKAAFVSQFPYGKIPAFAGNDGYKLTETIAILRYIASQAPNSTLLGSSSKEDALVEQWLAFAQLELHAHRSTITALCKGVYPYNKPYHTALVDKVFRALRYLDLHLSSRTFLVTERITIADINLVVVLHDLLSTVLDAATRPQFPNVVRYFETVSNQPKIKEAIGSTTYIEKAISFVPPAKEKKDAKAAKPSQEPKPKAEKKAEPKPKPKEDDDEDDDLVPKEEPKAKNPLDSLPKSNFNLEDWKRSYSNMDTRGAGGSIEWFYGKYDPEGFSVWRIDYKYPTELTQTFMSSNLIGGFFNRLEASRKYLFGSMGVLGKTNDSLIAGVLICRGTDIKPVVEVAPDWESYEYKAIDLKDDAQKAFFEAALAWDLEVDGKAWVDGKTFK